MKVTAFLFSFLSGSCMSVCVLFTVLCQCKVFIITSYLQKLTTTIICQICHSCYKSYWTLNPHSLSIFYFIVRGSALGVITVACLSISGHAHNSLSCNLVIKQLTFLNHSTTNNEYGYLHSSDRRERGREDRVDKLIHKELKQCQLFL